MESPPKSRRLRRLIGRITAAALGATAAGASTAQAAATAAAADLDDPRHETAAHWLAISLEQMQPLPATYTACQWALSPDPEQRATVATALERAFRLVGDSVILDHLSRDPSPAIRVAVARAAWIRQPALADEVLARLADDPSPEVREVAQLASRGR
jgi:hypothetical protein